MPQCLSCLTVFSVCEGLGRSHLGWGGGGRVLPFSRRVLLWVGPTWAWGGGGGGRVLPFSLRVILWVGPTWAGGDGSYRFLGVYYFGSVPLGLGGTGLTVFSVCETLGRSHLGWGGRVLPFSRCVRLWVGPTWAGGDGSYRFLGV